MSESEQDTSQVVVQTYVPAYQRDQWDDHADDLDMSRSEFVRTMVQAGRRGFGDDGTATTHASGDPQGGDDPGQTTEDITAEILTALQDGPVAWDDLIETVIGDVETEVESALKELEEAGSVRYSGPKGGYILTDGAEE